MQLDLKVLSISSAATRVAFTASNLYSESAMLRTNVAQVPGSVNGRKRDCE